MKCSAIILAAGKGTRFGGHKQDVVFHNMPLWQYVFDATRQLVHNDRIVIVGRDVNGGDTRSASVICGLNSLPNDTERVIILEAARPLVTKGQIEALIMSPHPSVSYVRPLVNTVVFRKGEYLNRSELYDLLTPQAFDYHLLLEAYRSGMFQDYTDETRVMFEFYGIKPFFIETGDNLFKVTYPGDMAVIETLYGRLINKEIM